MSTEFDNDSDDFETDSEGEDEECDDEFYEDIEAALAGRRGVRARDPARGS